MTWCILLHITKEAITKYEHRKNNDCGKNYDDNGSRLKIMTGMTSGHNESEWMIRGKLRWWKWIIIIMTMGCNHNVKCEHSLCHGWRSGQNMGVDEGHDESWCLWIMMMCSEDIITTDKKYYVMVWRRIFLLSWRLLEKMLLFDFFQIIIWYILKL